ncbi:hypothetical protein [Haloarcula halophila]|uniref:hypothetical protein n=1 Tax=Haloarcula TaxID=2237 RepID=UPI0023E35AAA|nr:hypothetical protein [Halomicroarcula sp. DFY41]
MDQRRDTPIVDVSGLEMELYFEIDESLVDPRDTDTIPSVRSATNELASELAVEPYIQAVNPVRYCLTPGLSPIYRNLLELSVATDTTVPSHLFANRLYNRLKQRPEVRFLQVGDETIPFSEVATQTEFARQLTVVSRNASE